MDFVPWPKTPRLTNEKMIVTEKIDGTNAQIAIEYYPSDFDFYGKNIIEDSCWSRRLDTHIAVVHTGSRNKWITPKDDNFGFARWVHENIDEVIKLGHGRHYGEWWGKGIQRGYDVPEKRLSLFNTYRPVETLPNCIGQVPVLYSGEFNLEVIRDCVEELKTNGSKASPGFMKPEGVCVYLYLTKQIYKIPFDK